MTISINADNEVIFHTKLGELEMKDIPDLISKQTGKKLCTLARRAGVWHSILINIKRGKSKSLKPLLAVLLDNGYEVEIRRAKIDR